MATKKKTRKKRAKAKRTAGKKVTKVRQTKKMVKRNLAKKKMAEKKAAPEKMALKTKAVAKKTIGGKMVAPRKKQVRRKSQSVDTVAFSLEPTVSCSSRQSGDLQGLSTVEGADSESVDELLEEGNAFEADAVMGVEDAGAAEGREVRTHEVPVDDVPSEYLDKE
jgi:hypothetical protein